MKQNCDLLGKNPEVCAVKPLFDFLQERDLKIINPIEITSFRGFIDLPCNLSSQKVWLWNQISDPNLGIHDYLELKNTDSAVFRWVLIGSKIVSIENLYYAFEDDEGFLHSRVELWDVMEKVCHSQKQFVSYFVAEGNYDGYNGIHICLTPYNDLTSVEALKVLFGDENFQKVLDSSDPDSSVLFDEEEILFSEVSEEKKRICNNLFLEHFQKSFQVLETVN